MYEELYGCETWTITTEEKRRLEAFEMRCYRRMLRISWMDRVTNVEKYWKDYQLESYYGITDTEGGTNG